jgi:membrane peptidoglycan carboxypeptidase
VTTTLDANVQNQLKTAIDANMRTIKNNGGSNAAAVAIDPATGEVRGLVGSYDWNDATFGKVNIATSLRQPGSSFKPIYYG